jgi:glutamate-ammonia-ligase adenylyltransferase
MRKQLDTSDANLFDLKQGSGGIGDVEFLVQYLVLRYADSSPAVVHYSDNIRQLGTLGAANRLSGEIVAGLQRVYREYRLRLHRLSLDERAPSVAATEFAEQREFVCGVWDDVMKP